MRLLAAGVSLKILIILKVLCEKLSFVYLTNASFTCLADDETSSIASTDSAGGMRRGRRESGTSSATQGTETETEVPTHTPEALRHRKSGSKSPSQEIEAARRRDCNQEREKSKDKEVPYSEEENVSLNALRPTDKVEEQEDEEMEDCGKYPGQKSSADNSDMEEDEEEEDE